MKHGTLLAVLIPEILEGGIGYGREKKVLLIDDDKDFLMATKLILEKGGYEVFLAEDGKAGVDMANPLSRPCYHRYDDGDLE